jgi:hypothetical protein
MRQSPLLTFRSSAFPAIAGEDEQTNPGIFGRALAQRLAEQLRSRGFEAGDAFAEDFGWCVAVKIPPSVVFVACASDAEVADRWKVFCFVEGGMIARLLGKDAGEDALASVFAALARFLESSSDIRELEEET